MNTSPITLHIAADHRQAWKVSFEGPSATQARKMAARRADLKTQAADALTAGQDDRAFDLDCEAWDIERDLRSYGFNVETGRKSR